MVGNDKAAKSRLGLVDLDGFEPSTSSMPFKKYQSLTDTSTRNKRLSRKGFGRQWTPRGGFRRSGLHADSRTPHLRIGTRRAFTRAVAGCCDCCLLEETTMDFLIRSEERRVGEEGRSPWA